MSDAIPPAIAIELARLAAADVRHESSIKRLETDMQEIRITLGMMATKEDAAEIRTHIDGAVNGLLRDALNAAPMRQSVLWGALVALATVGMLIVSWVHH